jgi:hypothetical protein
MRGDSREFSFEVSSSNKDGVSDISVSCATFDSPQMGDISPRVAIVLLKFMMS